MLSGASGNEQQMDAALERLFKLIVESPRLSAEALWTTTEALSAVPSSGMLRLSREQMERFAESYAIEQMYRYKLLIALGSVLSSSFHLLEIQSSEMPLLHSSINSSLSLPLMHCPRSLAYVLLTVKRDLCSSMFNL